MSLSVGAFLQLLHVNVTLRSFSVINICPRLSEMPKQDIQEVF